MSHWLTFWSISIQSFQKDIWRYMLFHDQVHFVHLKFFLKK